MPDAGVDILAVDVDPVVQVRPRREPGGADTGECRALSHHITFANEDGIEVEVCGVNALTMVQYEGLPRQCEISNFSDCTRLRGANACSTTNRDIDPGVTPGGRIRDGGRRIDAK